MLTRFYTKEGLTIENLINDLIDKSIGDRIKSISDYCKEFDVARGTVQSAFKFLTENKAIEIDARGRLGSSIKKIDKTKLIELYGKKKFIGVMPLPYSPLYQGLATGLFLEAQEKKIDLQMAFMRGAESRIGMLLDGNYDFVIMSRLSANYYVSTNDDVELVCNFGQGTYVKKHAIVLNSDKKVDENFRFGIDVSSRDMEIITRHECIDKDLELVEVPYMQLYRKLLNGEIDGAVMNYDNIDKTNPKLIFKPIDEKYFKGSDTEASLITRKDNRILKEIFKQQISVDNIVKIQDDVFTGKQYPIY